MPSNLLTPPKTPQQPPQATLGLWQSFKIFVKQDLSQLLFFILIAVAIGIIVEQIWWCIAIAFIIFFSLQICSLFFLNHWINQNNPQQPPYLWGVWRMLAENVQAARHQELQTQLQSQQHITQLIEKTQQSLKNLSQAIVLINHHYEIEWSNLTAVDLLAIEQSHQSQKIDDILNNSQFSDYLQNADFYPDGIKMLCPEYQNRYIQLKITDFGEEHRLIIADDITRIHNLEQMRKDFVDNVSHELRTPLTVLSGYIETFKEQDDLPQRWERAFNQMQSQTKRMTALVNDLLLLSNLENPNIKKQQQLVEMPNLMNHLFDDAQAYNVDYGHTLHLDIDSHCDVLGTEAELTSAFNNLITNAIKYTPQGGTITIGWHDHEDGAFFSVQDTGIGISAEHLPRLTERFYRVDTARSRLTGGTGLGLAIVKHVLIQHDARLEIQSHEGQGSLFKVIFPKHRTFTTQEQTVDFIDR
ncbi:MAG: phosphate regulon sensor histidine kinase PhoR [Acinetobacter sp.]|nr:phosphate regulon sensor histidine kinase PhoR [Acinetobacter sp.]